MLQSWTYIYSYFLNVQSSINSETQKDNKIKIELVLRVSWGNKHYKFDPINKLEVLNALLPDKYVLGFSVGRVDFQNAKSIFHLSLDSACQLGPAGSVLVDGWYQAAWLCDDTVQLHWATSFEGYVVASDHWMLTSVMDAARIWYFCNRKKTVFSFKRGRYGK